MGLVPFVKQCCCGCKLRTGSEFCGWWGLIFGTFQFLYFVIGALRGFPPKPISQMDNEIACVYIVVVCVAIVNLLRIIASGFLLIGVYQEKASYFLPWIIFSTVVLALYFVMMLPNMGKTPLPLFIFIIVCIEWYFIMVVNSDYWQQNRGNREGNGQLV